MWVNGWLFCFKNDAISLSISYKKREYGSDKRYFILEKCCIQIKLCTPHMRQFLIHRRNQWKIFSLKIRREKEKWIFLVFLTKLSLEKPSLGSKISEEMLVVFMKGKRKVVLRRSYIFICIEFVNMCDYKQHLFFARMILLKLQLLI